MAGSASGRVVGNWVCLLVLLVLAGALGACGEEAALSELAASEDTAEPVTVDDVGEGEDPGSGEEDAGGEPAPPSKRLTGEGVQVSATLGGEGGKVEVDDGSAEVAFEPESLGEETRVSVTRFDVANGAGDLRVLGPALDIVLEPEPEGAIEPPARLTFTEITADGRELHVARLIEAPEALDSAGGDEAVEPEDQWLPLAHSTYDEQGHPTVLLTGFSVYTIVSGGVSKCTASGQALTPPAAPSGYKYVGAWVRINNIVDTAQSTIDANRKAQPTDRVIERKEQASAGGQRCDIRVGHVFEELPSSNPCGGCDDGNGCTVDACDQATKKCTHTPNNLATVSCYDGPDGTGTVGECRLGTALCAGGKPGPCLYQVKPAAESANGKDDDCDGLTDEDLTGCKTFHADKDGDGHGSDTDTACLAAPEGAYSKVEGGDCDDSDPNVNPKVKELCGTAADDDCDGDKNAGGVGCVDYYGDRDGDGYGVGASCLCQPEGDWKATKGGDCDDSEKAVNPGAAEVCNSVDDDCDQDTDEGFSGLGDPCDGPDSDQCKNGKLECSADGSGTTCGAEFPADIAEECNLQDDDCDGDTDEGFGSTAEQCNGKDDDCDGTTDEDVPPTTDATVLAATGCETRGVCGAAGGMKAQCVPHYSGIWRCKPSHPEFDPTRDKCDGLDNDCDGSTDEDATSLGQPCDSDDDDWCNDDRYACKPGDSLNVTCVDTPGPATCGEVCWSGRDDDGDGKTDCDDDDCRYELYCGSEHICNDNKDNDHDGVADCLDQDCFGPPHCTEENTKALCIDGFDNDQDGHTDCGEGQVCWKTTNGNPDCTFEETVCDDGFDNEGDGRTDCHDGECQFADVCTAPESDCGDLRDNDQDGASDCFDPGCWDRAPCITRESDCDDGKDNDGDRLTDCKDEGCRIWGSFCKREANCDNHIDDDKDGKTDCDDPGCRVEGKCVPGSEVGCRDGIDNDLDNLTDCYDLLDCDGHADCKDKEYNCKDGKDNDGNGKTDCADAHCQRRATFCWVNEKSCNDGIDNDGDGLTDCQDRFPCVFDEGCMRGESNCTDRRDNDGDGATDCWDPGCQQVAPCSTVESDCGDGIDNDKDGFLDCADVGCRQAQGRKLCRKEADCNDGKDDDGDGKTDCDDPGCKRHCFPKETKCSDGKDDDRDGKTDCEDEDCAGPPDCTSEEGRKPCGDGVDNDNDGRSDCYDDGCWNDEPCGHHERSCEDGIDNDGDGMTDCVDHADCGISQECQKTEADCGDNRDNDGDGATDCFDPGCSTKAPCTTVESDCADKKDNDGDGYTDCSDLGCEPTVTCKKEDKCRDGKDNDNDGKTDCEDPGCIRKGRCLQDKEVDCRDGIDDDEDNSIDCRDTEDCENAAACQTDEWKCLDRKDNDGDGFTDCEDLNCHQILSSTCSDHHEKCADGIDNDGDGLTDCQDWDLCGIAEACEKRENCADGRDDDGDGATDCWDPACRTHASCTGKEADCNDGKDNDNDGLTDCIDVGCRDGALCAPEDNCVDSRDNDNDGKTDCEDPGCRAFERVCRDVAKERACADGKDNDKDGSTDCADDDCKGLVCNDNDICTYGDKCQSGQCKGTARSCDDSVACTLDTCAKDTGKCANTPNHSDCADSYDCTVDACVAGKGCESKPDGKRCDDGDACTDDLCTMGFGCANPHNTAPCDDGKLCTIHDECKGGSCAGVTYTCDDKNPCTDDACDEINGCTHTNNTKACDDGDFCTDGDACKEGKCVSGAPRSCDDSNECTDDTCSAVLSLCVNANNSNACDDNDVCTQIDMCKDGKCEGGLVQDCDDKDPCTDDNCSPLFGCGYTNNTDSCDDGDACTQNDVCDEGSCTGPTAVDCNDSDPCTTDSCDKTQGCLYTVVLACCRKHGDCNDNDICTDDTCGIDNKCSFVANPACCTSDTECVDGNPCTADTCKDNRCTNPKTPGCCQGDADCDDNDPCTTDSCGADNKCANTTATDGTPCATGKECRSGECVDKAVPCTAVHPCCKESDSTGCADAQLQTCVCAADNFCCQVKWDVNCISLISTCGSTCGPCCDQSATPGCGIPAVQTCVCNLDASCCSQRWHQGCVAAAIMDCGHSCGGGGGSTCDDGDPCTTDSCDPDTSTCTFTPVANGDPCDDGDGCTEGETCTDGTCSGGTAKSCDDNNECTTDICEPGGSCAHTLIDDERACGEGGKGKCRSGVCEGGSGVSPCCVPQIGPGCAADKAVETCVCAVDPFCCDTLWDQNCADMVAGEGCGSCGSSEGAKITSFTHAPEYVPGSPELVREPLLVTFSWSIENPGGATLKCTLSPGDGDGLWPYTVQDCANTTSQPHTYWENSLESGTYPAVLAINGVDSPEASASVDVTVLGNPAQWMGGTIADLPVDQLTSPVVRVNFRTDGYNPAGGLGNIDAPTRYFRDRLPSRPDWEASPWTANVDDALLLSRCETSQRTVSDEDATISYWVDGVYMEGVNALIYQTGQDVEDLECVGHTRFLRMWSDRDVSIEIEEMCWGVAHCFNSDTQQDVTAAVRRKYQMELRMGWNRLALVRDGYAPGVGVLNEIIVTENRADQVPGGFPEDVELPDWFVAALP